MNCSGKCAVGNGGVSMSGFLIQGYEDRFNHNSESYE